MTKKFPHKVDPQLSCWLFRYSPFKFGFSHIIDFRCYQFAWEYIYSKLLEFNDKLPLLRDYHSIVLSRNSNILSLSLSRCHICINIRDGRVKVMWTYSAVANMYIYWSFNPPCCILHKSTHSVECIYFICVCVCVWILHHNYQRISSIDMVIVQPPNLNPTYHFILGRKKWEKELFAVQIALSLQLRSNVNKRALVSICVFQYKYTL